MAHFKKQLQIINMQKQMPLIGGNESTWRTKLDVYSKTETNIAIAKAKQAQLQVEMELVLKLYEY